MDLGSTRNPLDILDFMLYVYENGLVFKDEKCQKSKSVLETSDINDAPMIDVTIPREKRIHLR
jgi:hypothetical protein